MRLLEMVIVRLLELTLLFLLCLVTHFRRLLEVLLLFMELFLLPAVGLDKYGEWEVFS